MERHEILEIMGTLKLTGMRAAFDEVIADGLKLQYPMPRIYKQTGNLWAVQILLGYTKIGTTVRYLGVDLEDALQLAETTEI